MLERYARECSYYLRIVREIIFPRRCAICGTEIDNACLCPTCRKNFLLQKYLRYEPREEFLAGQAPALAQDVLRGVLLLYKYDGLFKEVLHKIKFAAQDGLIPPLREEAEAALPAPKLRWLGQYDIITCIPASRERRAQRGFDLPYEIFMPLLEQRGGEFQADLLERVRHTDPLFDLQPQERRSELAGCFALAGRARVAGKRILLCDDIYTTGSTLAEAAQVFLRAGALSVDGLALAAASSHWGQE